MNEKQTCKWCDSNALCSERQELLTWLDTKPGEVYETIILNKAAEMRAKITCSLRFED